MTEVQDPTALAPLEDSELLDREFDAPDPLLGETLHDTYLIHRVVGEGGMGRVYEAHHTRIPGKRFAVKVLRADLMHSPEVRTRFHREAQAAASIHHPNVIGVYDYGHTPDERPYLVAEFLDGVELRAHVERAGPLPIELAVYVGRRICAAIQAAHVHGVIHRDLKPENIFLIGPLDRPEVKVLDFGLSRFMDPEPSSTVTRAGVVMGTPAYMAPEQARGERVDHRVDVYGVGVVLYVALTGRAPFSEETPQQTVLAVLSQEPVRPRAHNPAVPEGLEIAIQRAMAREVEERYASAADLDAALAPFDSLGQASGALTRRSAPSGADEFDLGPARLQLVSLLVFAVLLGLVLALVTVAGLPRLRGWRALSPIELGLVLLAVTGTALTPILLGVRHLRRRVWNSSLRTTALVPALRLPLLSALGALGALGIVGLAVDTLAVTFAVPGLVTGLGGWGGWGPILTGVALVVGVAAALRRRLVGWGTAPWRRALAASLLFGGTALVVVALVREGFVAHERQAAVTSQALAALAAAPPPVAVTPAGDGAGAAPAVAPEAPRDEVAARFAGASAVELEKALEGGRESLEVLARSHPSDPAVLAALALANAGEAGRAEATLATLERLFDVDPERADETELVEVIVRIALARGGATGRALDLLAHRTGAPGRDRLYDIYLTSNELRSSARERLDDPKVQDALTPALHVTYALRVAKTCADRLPLLARAGTAGDERTIAVLRHLSARSRRGCGRNRAQPCPPTCPAEAAQFERTAIAIQQRLTQAEQRQR